MGWSSSAIVDWIFQCLFIRSARAGWSASSSTSRRRRLQQLLRCFFQFFLTRATMPILCNLVGVEVRRLQRRSTFPNVILLTWKSLWLDRRDVALWDDVRRTVPFRAGAKSKRAVFFAVALRLRNKKWDWTECDLIQNERPLLKYLK